jgi:alpha-beta hydrolase superfamily lysophospholipase
MDCRALYATPALSLAIGSALMLASPAHGAVEKATTDLIEGTRLESLVIRQPASKAVVVFENGSRVTLDKWDKVIEAVSPEATVFAYNRSGYGKSEATDATRDGDTIVEQLREILKRKGLQPPYILVGHSLGGLYVQLFARRHPEEVQGIVLVDALFPRVVKKTEDFPWATQVAKKIVFSSVVSQEIDNIYDTGEAVLAAPGIDDKPMVVLINKPTSATALPVDFGAIDNTQENVAFVRKLYPKAKKIVVDSDHQMQTANPEVIAAAIKDMIHTTAAAAAARTTAAAANPGK